MKFVAFWGTVKKELFDIIEILSSKRKMFPFGTLTHKIVLAGDIFIPPDQIDVPNRHIGWLKCAHMEHWGTKLCLPGTYLFFPAK